jgi:hypothetical protein
MLADATTSGLPQGWQFIFGGLGALVALGVVWRYTRGVRWRIRDSVRRFKHGTDVLVGFPEIRDPSNSQVLREAIPGIGEVVNELKEAVAGLKVNILEESRGHAQQAATAANYARSDAAAAKTAAEKAVAEVAENRRAIDNLVVNIDEIRAKAGLPRAPRPFAHRRHNDTDEAGETT